MLDEQRVVVLSGAVAGRHQAPDELADLAAVDQHVDRQDEDQYEIEADRHQARQQPPGEGDDVTGALEDRLLQRVQGALALLGDVDADAVLVEEILDIGQVPVGVARDLGQVVLKVGDLGGHRAGKQEADRHQDSEAGDVDRQDRQATGHDALQPAHPGRQPERHQRGDDEDQHHGPGRAGQSPQREEREGQEHQLHPARNDHRCNGSHGGVGGGPRVWPGCRRAVSGTTGPYRLGSGLPLGRARSRRAQAIPEAHSLGV